MWCLAPQSNECPLTCFMVEVCTPLPFCTNWTDLNYLLTRNNDIEIIPFLKTELWLFLHFSYHSPLENNKELCGTRYLWACPYACAADALCVSTLLSVRLCSCTVAVEVLNSWKHRSCSNSYFLLSNTSFRLSFMSLICKYDCMLMKLMIDVDSVLQGICFHSPTQK